MEDKVVLASKQNLKGSQMIVDCRFLASSGNEIGKVLSVSATPFVSNIDTYPSTVKYSGKVNFKLIYLTEDGRIISVNNMSDFDETVDVESMGDDAFAQVNFKVVDVTTPSVKTNEVKVACVMESVVSIETKNAFEGVQPNEGVFCKKKAFDNYELCSHFKEAFELEEEIRINDDLEQVLTLDCELCVKEVFAGNGFIVVSGEVFCVVAYTSENCVFKTYKQAIDFKQEIESQDATTDSKVNVNLNLQHNLIKMSVIQEDGYNTVRVELPIMACGSVYNKVNMEVVEDVYSENELLEVETVDLNTLEQVYSVTFEDFVREIVPIGEVQGAKLLGFSGANVVVSSSYFEDDKLTVEGVVSGTAIFDLDSQINSIIAEVPFVVSSTKSECRDLDNLEVVCGLCDFDLSLKNDSEMELSAKLGFFVTGTKHKSVKGVLAVTPTTKRSERDCSIEIVVTSKESSLWDLGKTLGVSAEQLLIQNPNLVEPIKEGEKVVVYYPKNVNIG